MKIDKKSLPENTRKVCEQVREQTESCVIAMSFGKDSVCCLAIARQYFKIVVPYYLSTFPVTPAPDHERLYAEYLGDMFSVKVQRLLNREIIGQINNLVWQPWSRITTIERQNLDDRNLTYRQYAKQFLNEYPGSWLCTGARSSDTVLQRRMHTTRKGVHKPNKTFYPIYDWTDDETFEFLEEHDILLPPEYACGSKSICNELRPWQLKWFKENMPEDYAKFLVVYPLLEADLARLEFRLQKQG